MNTEELDASIRSHLDRRDTYTRPTHEDVELLKREDSINGFYFIFRYAFPLIGGLMLLKACAGRAFTIQETNHILTFFGVIGLGWTLWRIQRQVIAEHEGDMIEKSKRIRMEQDEYILSRKKGKKKILFRQED